MLEMAIVGWLTPRLFAFYLLFLLIHFVGLWTLCILPLLTSAKVHVLLP